MDWAVIDLGESDLTTDRYNFFLPPTVCLKNLSLYVDQFAFALLYI